MSLETLSDILPVQKEEVSAVNPVKQETAQKLVVLKQDVGPINLSVPEKAPESNETKSSFDRVFEGTRSETFSRENRMSIRILIEGKLELDKYKWLTSVHRENIALAMTDRLLVDPDFQGIFRISIGFADMLNGFMKGNANKKTLSENTEQTVETKSGLSNLEERITACASRVTMPLRGLLEKGNTPEVHKLLDNPQVLAGYNGGVVEGNVMDMTPEELQRYITGLNGKILEIDRRVLPLEDLRERGMDFIASGPDFLRDILKWIFEKLPFIGNMLASFLQYKDSDDALRGIDDELRQRRSLSVLRQFGRVTDMEGKEKDGEYIGKIDILKGKDLSGIKRKKLANFFIFTHEEGIDTTTPDFWMGIFNDGKITTKDKDGKEQTYEVGKITGGDFEKNFEGLYGKLNKLKVTRDVMNAKEEQRQAEEKEKQAKQEQEAKEKQEKADAEAKTAKEEAEKNKLKPFADLYRGSIDKELIQKISHINIESLSNGSYKTIIEDILKKDAPKKDVVLAELTTLVSVINGLRNGNKMEAFQNKWLKKGEKFDMSLQNIYFHRQYLLAELGYTKDYLHIGDIQPQTVTVATSSSVTPSQEAPQSPVVEKKAEEKPTADTIISHIQKIEANTPIVKIPVGPKNITFDSNTQLLGYNGEFYHIELPENRGYKVAEVFKTQNNQIQFKPISDNGSVPLEGWWPKPGSIDEFSQGLMTMISTGIYEKKNDKNKIIMRIAKA